MWVCVNGGDISDAEKAAYIERGQQFYGERLQGIDVTVDGDYVDLAYTVRQAPFERIRRITGYLVGTLDRWNDSKQAEERDRVKHDV